MLTYISGMEAAMDIFYRYQRPSDELIVNKGFYTVTIQPARLSLKDRMLLADLGWEEDPISRTFFKRR